MKAEHIGPGPVELASLVAYQPVSIVFRTILDTQAVTITLFAFDAGLGLS